MPLAWRLLWRDLRHGELWLLLAALILAVAATTSLRFFSASLEDGLKRQAASLIGADLVLSSSRPLRAESLEKAARLGLVSTTVTEFSSMLQHGDDFQLASVKAVAPDYPLRGELQARDSLGPRLPAGTPGRGQVWVDERLLALLGASLGDSVQLGDIALEITAVLTGDPDRGGNLLSAFAPRALISSDDVAAAGVILPGSRITYRLLLTGTPEALASFGEFSKAAPGPGERLRDVAGARPEIGTPLTRASDYLGLAAIAAVVLAGVAVAISARRFGERHYDAIALMRCLGASSRHIRRLYGWQLLLVWAVAIIIGGLLGWLSSWLLHTLLQSLLPGSGLVFSWQRPLLTGIATATLTLAGFALPALLALFRVSPLRVLRRELAPATLSQRGIYLLAFAALFLLLALETGRWQLTAIVLAGGGVVIALLALGIHTLLRRLRHRAVADAGGNAWRTGLRELWRHPQATQAQLLGFALALTAMLLVTSLRGELMSAWQDKLPADAPNHFALGIPAGDKDAFGLALEQAGLRHEPLYPVYRGRLAAINGEPVRQAVSADEDEPRNDEALNRELNLTTSATLPAGNQLLSGSWRNAPLGPPDDAGSATTAGDLSGPGDTAPAMRWPVSVEERLAGRLGLSLGDRLTFTLAEGNLEAEVTSLREVDWDSFQPNFFMVFPPQALDGFPASYLTSFHVPDDRRDLVRGLVQRFPVVVLIDVGGIMAQVRGLLDQLAQAIGFVLLFVLAAGVLVLLACIAATLDSRRQEAALLRALGASRASLRQRVVAEMLALGAIAGVLAVVLAEVIAAVLHLQVLDLPPALHPRLWLLTPLAGALITGSAGLLGTRRVWRVSPLRVLADG